jgi:hypothetical protein
MLALIQNSPRRGSEIKPMPGVLPRLRYQTVTYWPLTCGDVFTRYFSTVRQAPALGKSIVTLDAGGSARIFLMPAGATGCVTIKKELL